MEDKGKRGQSQVSGAIGSPVRGALKGQPDLSTSRPLAGQVLWGRWENGGDQVQSVSEARKLRHKVK